LSCSSQPVSLLRFNAMANPCRLPKFMVPMEFLVGTGKTRPSIFLKLTNPVIYVRSRHDETCFLNFTIETLADIFVEGHLGATPYMIWNAVRFGQETWKRSLAQPIVFRAASEEYIE
jgi:hypothetical protein